MSAFKLDGQSEGVCSDLDLLPSSGQGSMRVVVIPPETIPSPHSVFYLWGETCRSQMDGDGFSQLFRQAELAARVQTSRAYPARGTVKPCR